MPYLGKSPLHGNYSKLDDFSGDFDGSDATHALALNGIAITPVTEAAVIISINGVIQEPVTDYTVSGTNITFTTAPASGANFFGTVMGEQLAGNTPSDSTITSAKLSGNLVTPGTLDLNGQELILDADADTSITADTDDQIDIKIAGADDFQFTANTLSVLSGSTLNIDSGATIANSGTATGFDPAAAAAGIIEANTTFVDAVIFGPAMDPVDWSGRTAAPTSALMLATIEDNGSNSEINIYDLTDTTITSLSPLATVTLTGAAPAYGIDAAMGYIVCAIQGGAYFIDPHDGVAWAARTTGWPRFINSSSTPAITNNHVRDVASGFSDQPAYDPRTGGPMPTFSVAYGTGADTVGILKDNGTVINKAGTINASGPITGITSSGHVFNSFSTNNRVDISAVALSGIIADDYGIADFMQSSSAFPSTFGVDSAFDTHGSMAVGGIAAGLSFIHWGEAAEYSNANTVTAMVNRTYNTGHLVGDIRGAWLANSNTADRGPKSNTLTNNGTITEAAVASGAELLGYSGWSTDNYLNRASDADWDVITTGTVYWSAWFKAAANSAHEFMASFHKANGAIEFAIRLNSNGTVTGRDDGATAEVDTTSGTAYDDSVWHKIDFFRVSSTDRYLYVDGALQASNTTDAGSLSDDGNLALVVGGSIGGTEPATNCTLALVHLSIRAPTATQIRQMYDAEKGMFVANAKCLLQSGSTDAVLDVSVDPITSKIAVTQTDSQMIWNGLVMESAPAVNAGASEHNKLFGGDRVEINAVNLYATIAAKNLRGDLDIVRGMKAGLPAGVDLSKAKAWAYIIGSGSPVFAASYNIKSLTDNGTGAYRVDFAIPFKSISYVSVGNSVIGSDFNNLSFIHALASRDQHHADYYITRADTGAYIDDVGHCVLFFGELENE